MIAWLRALACRRGLRRWQIKLSLDPRRLPRQSVLVMEHGVSIGDVLPAFRQLQVGALTYIRSSCELINVKQIGRFCSIGNQVIIGQERAGHPLDWVSSHPFQYTGTALNYEGSGAAACIGHDVWIGREAIIMEGVRIGTGAVVAARAVVTADVPDYAIVAGSPARILRYRHSEALRAALLASAWWELPLEQLQRLPLDRPDAFLKALPLERPSAKYAAVRLTRDRFEAYASEEMA